jgi:hypothetical protein
MYIHTKFSTKFSILALNLVSGYHVAYEHVRMATVSLHKRKLSISRSCPFLVLTIVLSRPRHADCKNSVKNYQGQLLPEKMRFENT